MPARDQLQLARQLWLDFDGGGYTVSDQISGRFARSWRLDAARRTRGSVASRSTARISSSRATADGHEGVEIRSGRADISADSRIEGAAWRVPATSFLLDFQSVSTTLTIPPGWRSIHATGADKVTGTWIDRWSLLNFFLLLVTTLAVAAPVRLEARRCSRSSGIGLIDHRARRAGRGLAGGAAGRGAGARAPRGQAARGGALVSDRRVDRAGRGCFSPTPSAEVRRGVHPAAERESRTNGRADREGFGTATGTAGGGCRASAATARRRRAAAAARCPRRSPARSAQSDGARRPRTRWLGELAIEDKTRPTSMASRAKSYGSLRHGGPRRQQAALGAESQRLRSERRRADRPRAAELGLGDAPR